MATSIFLAKVIGIYLTVDGLLAITRKDDMIPVLDEFKNNKIGLMMFGIVVFILGLLITTSHNVWSGSGFQIMITIIGWLLVIKGLLVSLMPGEFSANLISKFNKPKFYTIGGSITSLIGLWLALSGFIL